MSVEWKQDGEDWIWVSRDRGFGGAVTEALRVAGDGSGTLSIAGKPVVSQTLQAKAVILSAAVKTLHGTPVQVIPAPPAGTYIEIISMHARLQFNTAAYDAVAAGDFLELRYTDGSGALLTATVSPVGFGDAVATADVLITPAASGVIPINAKVVAFIAATEWFGAAGDGDLHLDILYRVRPLAI